MNYTIIRTETEEFTVIENITESISKMNKRILDTLECTVICAGMIAAALYMAILY